MGVEPKMLKSYELWVYFQMYSPENTRYLPKACSNPAWNSLRQPGLRGVTCPCVEHPSRGFKTASAQPMLASTRFSLKGVSNSRAYETRKIVPVFFRLYA